MTHRFFLLFVSLCVLLSAATVLGQDDDPVDDMDDADTPVTSDEALFRSYNQIDEVSIEQTDDGLQLIIRSMLPDGCEFPVEVETSRQGHVWFVDVYRDMPLAVMCPMVVLSDERSIDADILNDLDDDAHLIDLIVINERVYHIERAQIEDVEGAEVPPPLLTPWYGMPVSMTRMETELIDGEMTLHAYWVPINGCEGATVARVRPVPHAADGSYEVKLYVAIDSDPTLIDCPALPMLVSPNQESFVLDHDPLVPATFNADVMTLRYLPDFIDEVPQVDAWERSLVAVEDAEQVETLILESFPPQITVNVTWEEGGPCAASYHEALQGNNGRQVTLEISRILAEDSECGDALLTQSMSFQLGSFEEGPVSIDVNGVDVEVEF